MMKKNKYFKFVSCLGVVGTLFFANLSQASDVTLLGGLNLSSMTMKFPPSSATTLSNKSFGAFTVGVTYTMHLMDSFGIEVGAFYQKRGYAVNVGPLPIYNLLKGDNYFKVNYLTIPVLVRYTVFPEYLQVGVGPYAAFAMSDITHSNSLNSTTTTTTRRQLDYSAFDWGFAASVRGSYPITSMIDVIGDARYQMGLKDVMGDRTTAYVVKGNSSKLRDFMFLAGARLNF